MRVFNDAVENQDVISVSTLLVLRALSQQQQKKPTLKDQEISKILLTNILLVYMKGILQTINSWYRGCLTNAQQYSQVFSCEYCELRIF